jgi:hypothetical protein
LRLANETIKMRFVRQLTLLALWLASGLAGCSKPKTDPPATSLPQTNTLTGGGAANAVDACSLLTSQEIETVLGAPLKDTKPSVNAQGGVTVSQCYFLLPVAADSIVLTLTQPTEGANSRAPKESWEEIFDGDKEKENAREEEESKSPPPERVGGLGDEAFWAPRRFGGVLYVLKGNRYVTITVGSGGDQATKLQRSKALAEIVLKRL